MDSQLLNLKKNAEVIREVITIQDSQDLDRQQLVRMIRVIDTMVVSIIEDVELVISQQCFKKVI